MTGNGQAIRGRKQSRHSSLSRQTDTRNLVYSDTLNSPIYLSNLALVELKLQQSVFH
jgi:hypothetical protein